MRLGTRFLPFADAATKELPLGRLLRLSLFQVSVGMAIVLLNGTLNRVMIVELGVSTLLVSLMVSLPLVFAPFRVLIGFRSDNHRSVLGWRRVPYIWMGTLVQFGGFAIMPFALLVLSGDRRMSGDLSASSARRWPSCWSVRACTPPRPPALRLATDLAPVEARPRVVAFLYVMLLFGMVGSALIFGELLRNFSEIRLIQVVQGVARHPVAAEHLRAVEAGGARPVADVGARASGPNSSIPGPSSAVPAVRSASWSRWRSAPPPSRCRTSCWSPMAPRS